MSKPPEGAGVFGGPTAEGVIARIGATLPPGARVRVPASMELRRCGYAPELIEYLREASKTGYLIAVCKLRSPATEDDPLPKAECRLFRGHFPYDLILRAVKLFGLGALQFRSPEEQDVADGRLTIPTEEEVTDDA